MDLENNNFDQMIKKLINYWQYDFNKSLYEYIIYSRQLSILHNNLRSKYIKITSQDWFDLAKSLED